MKSFINADDGSSFTDVSPVLTCILSLKESEAIWNKEKSRYVKSVSFKQLKSETDPLRGDGFVFAVSLRDGSCLYTSNEITNHLGYPKDMWLGQCMMNFIHQKDHITFANHLTQGLNACFMQGKRDDSHLVINTFFCRMRLYHGLKFGYSLADKKSLYKPFKVTLHLHELIFDDICVEKPEATLCVKATATQVTVGYSIPEEIPAMTSFSTRHTSSCHFSHVDVSAIPYLGYLPQDMIGNSVFDFYHIDDMPQLKDIYELVVKERGTSFRSQPYRFKVQNNCYIMLETEWSCFINPWSHKLEFIVGQHRVLKGPSDINIFTPCEVEEIPMADEIIKESQRIQKEIKALLSQTIKSTGNMCAKRFCNKRKRDLASFVYSCVDEGYVGGNKRMGNGEKADQMGDKSNADSDSVVMGGISPFRELNDSSESSETHPSVQQLRYQENIERFFASQPKTYSDDSEEYNKNEKSIGESYQASSSGSGNGSGKESGNASKEQNSSVKYKNKIQESSSNSSKCNISSGDSGYGKSFEKKDGEQSQQNQECSSNEAWKTKNDCVSKSVENLSSCLALTEEILSVHNKINHKHLKQHQRKNKSTLGLPANDNNWFQMKDSGHFKYKKEICNITSTPTQTDTTNVASEGPQCPTKTVFSDPYANLACAPAPPSSFQQNNLVGSTPAPSFFIPVVYMGSLPYYPPISTMHHQAPFWSCTNGPSEELPSRSLPVIPPSSSTSTDIPSCFRFPDPSYNFFSGIPFGIQAPQIFKQPPLHSTTNALTFSQSLKAYSIPKSNIGPNKKELEGTSIDMKREINECDMQIDDTRSSSFTQSSSFQSADKDEDMDYELKKIIPNPSHCEKAKELSSEVAFRYQMELPQMSDVLRKDMEVLRSMNQPEPVNEQLQMLREEMQETNETETQQDFFMKESSLLGFITEDNLNEELEQQEDFLLQLMCEDS